MRDKLEVVIPEHLIGKNGKPISKKSLVMTADGESAKEIEIQPMVDMESSEMQSLETTTNSIFSIAMLIMVAQFLMVWIIASTLEYFWALINS